MPTERAKPSEAARRLRAVMSSMQRALVVLTMLLLTESVVAVRRRLVSTLSGRSTFATPNFTIYHRQDELLREVVDIVNANPGFMKLEVLSAKDDTYDAEIKVVTVEPGGFSDRQLEKVRILLDFGEHGRELVSSELGLLLLHTLAARDGVLRVFPEEPDRGRQLQRLLDGTVIKILPMENEGGRRLVEAGRLCERKNGRGVDPNRNWLVDWGNKEPDYDPNEEYPGTAPFSEPETQLLRQLAEEFKPQVWVNVHSGMEAMLAPWDHVAEVAREAYPAVDILNRIHRDLMTNSTCVVGSGGKTVGYLAHGTATDYMFKVLNIPIAYTWEIYGDFKAHFDDCFRMFNPVDEATLQETLLRWLRAIMRLVELIPAHPALKDSKAWSGADAASASASSLQQGGGQGNVLGGGAALMTGVGATTSNNGTQKDNSHSSSSSSTNTVTLSSTSSSITSTTTAEHQQQQGGEAAASTSGTDLGGDGAGRGGRSSSVGSEAADQPRIAVVASIKMWGSSWSAGLYSALLAVAGLAVVGVLAYRCLSRPSGEPRRGRGMGYQPA